jgi:hypothetical protein
VVRKLYLIDGVSVPLKTWKRAQILGERAWFQVVELRPKVTKY